MAGHPNRPSPQNSSSMPKLEPACHRRKSGRPKARLALAYEREARPGICAPPRLRAAGRGSSRTPSAPKLDHPRQDRQTSDRADCNVTVPSTGAPNGCCRTPATKVLAAAAQARSRVPTHHCEAALTLRAPPPLLPFPFPPSRLLAPAELCARRLGPVPGICTLFWVERPDPPLSNRRAGTGHHALWLAGVVTN